MSDTPATRNNYTNGNFNGNTAGGSSLTPSSNGSSSSTSSQNRSNTRILCTRFNQEQNCISVGTTSGYRILNCEPFAKCYEWNEGGVSIVEMLFCTSLLCIVGAGEQPTFSPRRLRLFNTKTEKYICELNFLTSVLNVKLNHQRLVVVLENKIHIFDLKNMKILHTIDTIANPTGICSLSFSPSNVFMCYPASEDKGEVFIYDAINLQVVSCIRAHNTPIRCCSFNQQGTMLATCSQQGTVIRVFSIPHGKKLFTFRRGTYPAKINTIHFNKKSDMIVVSSSDSSTVHIFSMKEPIASPKPHAQSSYVEKHSSSEEVSSPSSQSPQTFLTTSTAAAGAMLKTVANSSAVTLAKGSAKAAAAAGVSGALSFLPNLLQDMVEPSRNFAYINLKDNAIPSVCAFSGDDSIMVVTTTGYFSVYSVPPLASGGGQCKLESEHSLLDQPSEAMGGRILDAAQQQQKSGFYNQTPPVIQDFNQAYRNGTATSVEYEDGAFRAQRR